MVKVSSNRMHQQSNVDLERQNFTISRVHNTIVVKKNYKNINVNLC